MVKQQHHSSHSRGFSQRTIRSFVSLIFAFLLSLLFLAGTLLIVIQLGFVDRDRFIGNLDDTYYQYVYDEIYDRAYDYTLPTGLDTTVLDDVFSLEDVKRDVYGYAAAALDGREFEPPLEEMEDRMTKAVEAFLEERNVTVDQETLGTIDLYVTEIVTIYKAEIQMPAMNVFTRIRSIFSQYLMAGILCLIAVALLLSILIVKVHHYPHHGIRYLAYAMGGTALMTFVGPWLLYQSRAYTKLRLSPEYFYYFIIRTLEQMLRLCFAASAIWLILMFLTILIVVLKRNRLKKKYHNS